MMKQSLLFAWLLLVALLAQAQDTPFNPFVPTTHRLSVNMGVMAGYLYPGGRIGAEYPLKVKKKEFLNKHGFVREKFRVTYCTLDAVYFNHFKFQQNVSLTATYGRKKIGRKGWQHSLFAGGGLCKTWLGGVLYTVDAQNNVSMTPNAGRMYGMGVLGCELRNTKKQPISYYFRPTLSLMFPYNSTVLPLPAIEVGINFPNKR